MDTIIVISWVITQVIKDTLHGLFGPKPRAGQIWKWSGADTFDVEVVSTTFLSVSYRFSFGNEVGELRDLSKFWFKHSYRPSK